MATCNSCLNGRHRRCDSVTTCTCSVCSPKRHMRAERATRDIPVHELGDKERAQVARPVFTPKTAKHRELSTDPKKVAQREYMREYRRRKENGETMNWKRYTETQRARALELRSEGWTLRKIGAELSMDFSWLSKFFRHEASKADTAQTGIND